MLSGRAAAQASELRILFPGGTWQEYFQQAIIDPFVADRGTEIVWKTGLGFEPLLIAQRRRPQWDLAHQNQNTSSQLGAMEAIEEWTEENIPNLAQIHPSFRYPHLAGKVHTPYGIAVNVSEVPNGASAWTDLWDPAFKGKVGFPAWNWMGQEVFHAINELNGGAPDNVDPGIERLKALFAENDAIIVDNVEHAMQLMSAGEVWIMPHFGARTMQIRDAGTDVEFILPEEGGLSFIWNTSVVANRPDASRELAFDLVNHSLSVEAQTTFSKLTNYPPTNIELMNNLPPELKHLEMTPDEVESLGNIQRNFDYMAMFAYRDEIKTRWDREVLGG
ncbi:putative ABC transporter, periplasmic solute-binding protein [Pseudooceanicola batsensis HTCC2597]|uniref:Putative ABC transporter, periplasmic solute-binding protein n=2 Tax=Pseudooceanicola batsensis TaxID=314255 RepID=A3U1H7_PSEBH|nr:putative ABC transporter, periplasmic solute-binding protein [Pseudooceanicola batsensis HTCC2597]